MAHVNQTDIANSTKCFNTVIVFRTQQLMDLWVNEMQGQISDGMWENCRKTDWLWRNEAHILGEKTEVKVVYSWQVGKKNYPLTKQLWECVGERILEENGFADKKEATKAWKEILEAIQNATVMTEEDRELYINSCVRRKEDKKKLLEKEVEETKTKLKEHFGESNVGETRFSDVFSIDGQIKNRSITINPSYDLTRNIVYYRVYVESTSSVTVTTFEKLLEAIELFRDFYTKRDELMMK